MSDDDAPVKDVSTRDSGAPVTNAAEPSDATWQAAFFLDALVNELSDQVAHIDTARIARLTERLVDAQRIFITAAGRSAVVARAFTNRLMHLGKTVYFVGDITTPAIQADDTLLVISNSGTTGGPLAAARTAHARGAVVVAISGSASNALAELADEVAIVHNEGTLAQPMGALSEQLTFLALESVVLNMMRIGSISEAEMRARHANLE